MTAKATILRAILILSVAASLDLQAQTGNISGTVTDSSREGALVGASVTVDGRALATTTDASGHYLLLGAPIGKASVKVSYLGLAPATHEVTVESGNTITQDFALTPATVSSSAPSRPNKIW